MEPVFRPLTPADQEAALALWDQVFKPGRGYFERYFNDDPWYRQGDSFGAWDGEQLVSAVHVCRRPLEWAGQTVWCGAIANVATREEYRRRGLSRELLRLAVDRMEATGMDFSMLFTGTFHHYAALGWEQVLVPQATVTLAPAPDAEPEIKADGGSPEELYWQCPPTPLLLQRPERYFRGWVGWNWEQWQARVLAHPDHGYAALRLPTEASRPARLLEWRAMDPESEQALLRAAARAALRAGQERLTLPLPYFGGAPALALLGAAEIGTAGDMMLRNVRLSEADYAEIKRLYATGDATWWPADGF